MEDLIKKNPENALNLSRNSRKLLTLKQEWLRCWRGGWLDVRLCSYLLVRPKWKIFWLNVKQIISENMYLGKLTKGQVTHIY